MGLRIDLVYITKELSRVLTEPTAEANKILAHTLQYIEQTKHARLDFTRDKILHYQPPKTHTQETYRHYQPLYIRLVLLHRWHHQR
jgi:hypothetical protein